jgi:hypothetical protein
MDRRSFIALAGAAGASALGATAVFRGWQEITPQVDYPGRDEGHYLRDRRALPPPGEVVETDIVILGSGISGIAAAWQLKQDGHGNALMIDGPQPYGNAAGGRFGDLEFPTGAHYLPLPSPESVHVRAILADLGIIQRDPYAEKPTYDERFILHAPEERLFINGRWQDGFVPYQGVPAREIEQHKRFFAEVERLRKLRGSDGKRVFVFPTVESSADREWRDLDRITLKQWLDQHGYDAPSLHWYLNYCCRDDYGTRYDKVSAWAGLHYYCSRWGQAANAGNGAWLTWPGGLQPLARQMLERSAVPRRAGAAVHVRAAGKGVEALCFTLERGVARTFLVRARRAICAMPVFVAARVVEGIGELGFDPRHHQPAYAPWMVSNFLMKEFPRERPDMPLCWDNVVYEEPGLGWVVSTHQDIRVAPPAKTVFTSYVALSDRTPEQGRKWLMAATPRELVDMASTDLRSAYGWRFAPCVERVDITVRGHAMAAPLPGFLTNAGTRALREADGPVLFAHADLSGFSVFEEAAWWGVRAAKLALRNA